MLKKDKIELSKKFADVFKSTDVIFTGFQGLKFKNITTLRENLKSAKAKFKVLRNTIISHAVNNAGLTTDDKNFSKGPTAVIMLENPDEITRVAKIITDFAKQYPSLKMKGGFVSQKWFTPQDCLKLSKIGSKTELIGQIANMLYSNLANIRSVLEAPIRDLAYVLEALKEKKSKETK